VQGSESSGRSPVRREPREGDSVLKLVAELQQGETDPAADLHDRYAQRLLGLVRQRMDPTINGRMDPEDVLQSAFRSFFRIVSNGDWDAEGRAEKVWCLLYAITLNKLKMRVRFHSAEKRSVRSEESNGRVISDETIPEAEVLLLDELEWVLSNSTEKHRAILQLLLQGQDPKAVAESQKCALRTVYRVAERAATQLNSRLSE